MGLDIVFYDRRNCRIGFAEFPKRLHNEIFSTENWESYKYIRKIKDYYRTDEVFKEDGMEGFKEDLIAYKIFISDEFISHIEPLIEKLNDKEIYRIHIAGD